MSDYKINFDKAESAQFRRANLDTKKKCVFWTLRINNPSDDEFATILTFVEEECKEGAVSGIETGKNKDNPHIHVIMRLQKDMTQSALAKKIGIFTGKIHPTEYCLQPVYGNWADAYNYTIKGAENGLEPVLIKISESRSVIANRKEEKKTETDEQIDALCKEFGVDTNEKTAVKYKQLLKKGCNKKVLDDLMVGMAASSIGKAAAKEFGLDDLEAREVDVLLSLWFYGSPGCGKTELINMLYPGCYQKARTTDGFNGYRFDSFDENENPHQVVWFDEVDTPYGLLNMLGKNNKGLETVKQVFGDAPYPVDMKYSDQIMVRPKLTIVTANIIIDKILQRIKDASNPNSACYNKDFFGNEDDSIFALLRRIERYHVTPEFLEEVYGLKKMNRNKYGLGGLFCIHHIEDINKEFTESLVKYATKKIDFVQMYKNGCAIRRKYRNLAIQHLEQYKWKSPSQIIDEKKDFKFIDENGADAFVEKMMKNLWA